MSNTFLTARNIATVAATLVGQDLGLGNLVYKDLASEFRPGSGKTVSVRVPGAVAAQTRNAYDKTSPIVLDELAEQAIDVTLNDHVYNAVALSEGDLSLDIGDFAKQVLAPQTSAIVKAVEARVAAAMAATPETVALTYASATPARLFTAMRTQLRDNGVSSETPLYAVVGSRVYGDLLDGPVGTFDADGKVRGIAVHESTRLSPTEVLTFVKDAFALVVRAPEVPQGATFGSSVTDGGFSMRFLRDYDASVAADRSVVGAFVAVQALPLVVDREDGTVSLVANGGAVRVDTATTPA